MSIIKVNDRYLQNLIDEYYHQRTEQARLNVNVKPLIMNHKGKAGSEFGYYRTYSGVILELHTLLQKLGITSMIDLGCGLGFLLDILINLNDTLRLKGIDNEKVLLEYAKIYTHASIVYEQGDLTKLTPKDLHNYEALYTYEPINCTLLAKEYADSLVPAMRSGQILIYLKARCLGDHLYKHPDLIRLEHKAITYSTPRSDPYYYFKLTDSSFSVYMKRHPTQEPRIIK